MLPDERRIYIYSHLHRYAYASVGDLVNLLGVSHMTIRRDLKIMEGEGKIKYTSGGAKLNEMLTQELPYIEKSMLHHSIKRQIGIIAEQLVDSGNVIYLDAGTTTYEIAKALAGKLKRITVITNDFTIADFLMSTPCVELYHTGGRVDIGNRSAVGHCAARFIRQYNIDIAFISTSSWDCEHGISTPDEGKMLVKQAVLASSKRNVLVSDSSKYGKYGMFHICQLDQIDDIICDDQLTIDVIIKLKKIPLRLHLVVKSS
ncbi:TPA: DeoR/GlpR family DNA-binding transcription regulator [Salmonella enterica subsp. enterica serovar Newport]|nr:DeoR/GlpR transcriptional regulator [Salmonella enterica]EEK2864617.1 DeoR/GlpR transcriptional regulator [Salmonella enterica]EEK2973697.1 DeoR/GlpR transcriptional regulator [Salmonella enterica]EFB7478382.1 DeoR/GlpR transcriptional regulator [Salmonella enterica subsp. enterica serovar Newport]EMD2586625.1 DeoR/GlpR transcriptional regulator [Salmonella enterica]